MSVSLHHMHYTRFVPSYIYLLNILASRQNKPSSKMVKMVRYIFGIVLSLIFTFEHANAQFIAQTNTVKDLKTGTIWLRCSVGQAWDPALSTCTGKVIQINQEQVAFVMSEATRQLGGKWRLPTLLELQSLVCKECQPPKINKKYFPNVSPEAYWTSDKNRMNTKMHWSVNFMTGHSYSRFFPYQFLPALLVSQE